MRGSDPTRRQVVLDLLEDADEHGLSAADRIVVRAFLKTASHEELAAAFREKVDNLTLARETLEYALADDWPSNVPLRELTERLLFVGETARADVVAGRLIRALPHDSDVVRLWAMSAPTIESAVGRFREGLPFVQDREQVLEDAREFLRRHQRPDLIDKVTG